MLKEKEKWASSGATEHFTDSFDKLHYSTIKIEQKNYERKIREVLDEENKMQRQKRFKPWRGD